MPFPFTCPNCRRTSQVLDQLAGTSAKCPTCSVVVDIPPLGTPVAVRVTTPTAIPVVVAQDDCGDDEFSLDPPRRRSSGSGGIVVALLVVGGLLLFGCVGLGGAVAYFFMASEDSVAGGPTSSLVSSKPQDTKPTARTTRRPADPANADAIAKKLLFSTPWLVVGDGRRAAVGSAVVVDRDERLLLANYHVVNKFDRLRAVFPELRDGKPITRPNHYFDSIAVKGLNARVVASDPLRDLALLQVDLLPADATAIVFAPASAVADQSAHTMGAAERLIGFGEEEGVLWRYAPVKVARLVQHEHKYKDGQRVDVKAIELPALDDPNDCGGPLVDDDGRLLGIVCDFNAADEHRTLHAIDGQEARAFVEAYFASVGRHWAGVPARPATGAAIVIDDGNELPSYWVGLLKQPNEPAAEKARAKLTKMGRVAVLELRKALRDADSRSRLAAASVLAAIGEHASDATDDLIKALGDPEPTIRAAAANALGKIGPSAHSAVPALAVLTADGQLAVRDAANEALPRVGPLVVADAQKLAVLWREPAAPKRLQLVAAIRKLKPSPAVAVELFAPLLADADAAVRIDAIQTMGDAGPIAHRVAFTKLVTLADDADPAVSKAALAALAKSGPAVAADRPALEVGLRAGKAEARLFCVTQLAALTDGARASVPDLSRLLRDVDPKVRAAAAVALGRTGKAAASVLNEVLGAGQDREPLVRAAAVEALGHISREAAVVLALFKAFDDADRSVREAAARGLRVLQPPLGAVDLSPLRTALRSRQVEARRFAAAELARLGTAVDALLDALEVMKDADFQVRRHLFVVLAVHGSAARLAAPFVIATMNAILQDDARQEGSLELFRQASITLPKIGDVGQAIPIWTRGLKSRDPGVRKEVVQSLGAVGPAARKAAKELCTLLDDPDVGNAVGDLLVKLRGDDVVRALCEVIDESTSVPAKLVAVRVVGRIGPEAKDSYQMLFRASTRYRGKELGEAARESLKLIQKN